MSYMPEINILKALKFILMIVLDNKVGSVGRRLINIKTICFHFFVSICAECECWSGRVWRV